MSTPTQEQIDGIAAVLGLLALAWPLVRRYLTRRQIEAIEEIAAIVVRATEVQGRDRTSATKMKDAVTRAQFISKRRGVKATDDEWKVAINEAVYQMKREGGEIPRQVPPPSDSLR